MARKSKTRVFIETSVFIRFLTQDDSAKFLRVVDLIERIEAGQVRAVTSNIVWLEVIYVLTKLYKFPRSRVAEVVVQLREMRSLVTIEKTDSRAALALWQDSNFPYGDCLIATQVPKNALLATFDSDFKKIPEVTLFEMGS